MTPDPDQIRAMAEIRGHGLHVTIAPDAKVANNEDWATVSVKLECEGFRGEFIGELQTSDILRFEAELRAMDRNLGTASTARLCSAEPNIDIKLKSDFRGHIVGNFRFESERRNGTPTELSGEFEMDQSFLPALIEQLRELAAALKPATA